LVMACNTATAAAIERLRDEHPGLPLIGVEPALKPAALLSRTGCIGVMATRGTLASARFRALLAAQDGHAHFVLQPCDGLADAIERSAATGDTTKTIALCAQYVRTTGLFGTQAGQIDTLVLGCTHYPFAGEALRALLGPEVQIVDNGEAVARQTRRLVQAAGQARTPGPGGRVSLFSTGQPQVLQAAAARWLGLPETAHTLHF
ncbi:MAG: aspartate/glutamate racemase family protein, partial [Polaromonas sp.]